MSPLFKWQVLTHWTLAENCGNFEYVILQHILMIDAYTLSISSKIVLR